MIEIPEKITVANGIEFDHEDNEYVMYHPTGMFMNIPSNAEILVCMSDLVGERFVTIRIPQNGILMTLYSGHLAPHITIC